MYQHCIRCRRYNGGQKWLLILWSLQSNERDRHESNDTINKDKRATMIKFMKKKYKEL